MPVENLRNIIESFFDPASDRGYAQAGRERDILTNLNLVEVFKEMGQMCGDQGDMSSNLRRCFSNIGFHTEWTSVHDNIKIDIFDGGRIATVSDISYTGDEVHEQVRLVIGASSQEKAAKDIYIISRDGRESGQGLICAIASPSNFIERLIDFMNWPSYARESRYGREDKPFRSSSSSPTPWEKYHTFFGYQ